MVEEAGGFLGRWARRKTEALRDDKPLDESADVAKPGAVAGAGVQRPASGPTELASAGAASSGASDAALPEKTALTLDDVNRLTQDSDFKPFMAHDVGPEVRNAAMKKLFADPHFNVMDGLDIYIDDYAKADPIPESMLRQMVGAKFLNLFEAGEQDGKQHAPSASPRENPTIPHDQSVAQSAENLGLARPDPMSPGDSSEPAPLPGPAASPQDHAHTHLRLQPDHAAPAPGTGRGTS